MCQVGDRMYQVGGNGKVKGGLKVYSLLNRWWYSHVNLQCQRKRIREDKFGFGHVEFQVPLGSLGRKSLSHRKI